MTGTTIQNHRFFARAGFGSARSLNILRTAFAGLAPFFTTRGVLASLLVFSLVFAAAFSESEEHELDGDPPASMLVMQSFDQSSIDQSAPTKGHVAGGHCAAHVICMPTPVAQFFVAVVQHTTWAFVVANWLEGSRSTRLDRPPGFDAPRARLIGARPRIKNPGKPNCNVIQHAWPAAIRSGKRGCHPGRASVREQRDG